MDASETKLMVYLSATSSDFCCTGRNILELSDRVPRGSIMEPFSFLISTSNPLHCFAKGVTLDFSFFTLLLAKPLPT